MKKIFELKYKDDKNASPKTIMRENVQALEILCKKASKKDEKIVLISPEKYEKPKNIYELSVIIAEDLILKYNEDNEIVRNS